MIWWIFHTHITSLPDFFTEVVISLKKKRSEQEGPLASWQPSRTAVVWLSETAFDQWGKYLENSEIQNSKANILLESRAGS